MFVLVWVFFRRGGGGGIRTHLAIFRGTSYSVQGTIWSVGDQIWDLCARQAPLTIYYLSRIYIFLNSNEFQQKKLLGYIDKGSKGLRLKISWVSPEFQPIQKSKRRLEWRAFKLVLYLPIWRCHIWGSHKAQNTTLAHAFCKQQTN